MSTSQPTGDCILQKQHSLKFYDIPTSMDSGKAVALKLLDLSAACDTIDHNTLFDCLSDWFGVDGTMLMWIKSYLTNCRQKVKLGNSFSDAFSLCYGGPPRFCPWSPPFYSLHYPPQPYNFQFQCYPSSVC